MHKTLKQTTETNVLHIKKNCPVFHVIAKISQTAQDPTGRIEITTIPTPRLIITRTIHSEMGLVPV